MSIRIKIFLGCFCLSTLTLLIGLLSQSSQREVGDLAASLYDNALVSTNALRSAQTALIAVAFDTQKLAEQDGEGVALDAQATERLTNRVATIEADLQLASMGSISANGRDIVDAARVRLGKLPISGEATTLRFVRSELSQAQDEIDAAVRVFAADAYGVKGDVGAIVHSSITQTRVLIGAALVLLGLVSWFLSRTIVPTLRRASDVIRSIAKGDLSTRIDQAGTGEASDLLTALASMQNTLADRFDRFERTVATQASHLDAERSSQNGKLQTTVESVSQGLCMFDRQKRVTIVNQHFLEIVGYEIHAGASFGSLAQLPELREVLGDLGETAPFTHQTADGRVLAISRRTAPDGGRIIAVDDVTDGHLAAARIDHVTNHDGMTGLVNRVALTKHLLEAIREGGDASRLGLLVLDIDGFRSVNEVFGHPIGDALLKSVADRLCELAGAGDLVARIGGDDFAIARTALERGEDMSVLAAAILGVFAIPFEIEGRKISVGASIGIAPALAPEGMPASADALILQAELALAAARETGRNRFRYFEPAMERESQRRRQMLIDLSKGLENGEFELFYQPFIDVPMHTIAGFEALLRWRHPEHGLVSPSEFVPLAEESGLIDPIGLWVLETACQHAANWPKSLIVSVNLSPIQFKNDDLFAQVAAILRRTGFEPYRLQLEVTEGVFLQDSEQVLATLTELRRLGVRISMDDFGTGYSSLGYLNRFPFDKVKIDQSFVRDLAKRENLMIVRAIIGLSKAMGLSVMAEGVETRRQMETLLAESCVEMQGYYFARPMPLSDLPRFMMQFSLDRGASNAPALDTSLLTA
ncbi:hypothetical protein GCM10011390_10880 [Aureimonas endophytica]|uniref:Diguanylate cyclase (GGDEF)-like protein n=1 Tax=Aureimonas endophytica TaxID=2027858 RepID=A0A916ZFG4_9HYPH|nr:EAL domain-containing protein [Aureimonas endophytica]GGD93982.1 hypothetical protein GCM10011390_10880 [Aureimonas endophytica]